MTQPPAVDLEELKTLLGEERDALRAGRFESFDDIATRKTALMAKLEAVTTTQSLAEMTRLREDAIRNAELLNVARKSLADAVRKAQLRLDKPRGLTVYGADGRKRKV